MPLNEEQCVSSVLGVLPIWGGLQRPSFEVGAALFSGILYPLGWSPFALAGSVPSLPTSPRGPRTLTLP